MATTVTEEHRRTSDALNGGRYDNFCLFSCYFDTAPAGTIAAVSVHELDSEGETEYGIHPLFVSVTPPMRLADLDGTEV